MKRIIFLLIGALLAGGPAARAQAPGPGWQWALGTLNAIGSANTSSISAVTTDSAGYVYAVGNFAGTITLAGVTLTSRGSLDCFVARISPTGQWQWVETFGGTAAEQVMAVQIGHAGKVLVGGYYESAVLPFGAITLAKPGTTQSHAFVACLSAGRQWQWAAQGAGDNVGVNGLAVDASGATYVGGYCGDVSTFGSMTLAGRGMNDGFLARLSRVGQWDWVETVGGANTDEVKALTVDQQGQLFVVGEFRDTVAFGTGPVPYLISRGNCDGFLLRVVPATGAMVDVQQLGGEYEDEINSLTVDAVGNVSVAGAYEGGPGFRPAPSGGLPAGSGCFVARYRAGAVWDWTAGAVGAVPGTGAAEAYALTPTPTGLCVAGYAIGGIAFGSSVLPAGGPPYSFLAYLSDQGVWQSVVGQIGALSLATAPSGAVCVGGLLLGSTTFGSVTLPGRAGAIQGFVAQLENPLGTTAEAPVSFFTLTPNPAHHTVRLTGAPAGPATLVDALGRTVRTWHLAPGTSDLSVEGLPAGLYTVRAGRQARRLVVE